MNSKEIIIATLEYKNFVRVARSFNEPDLMFITHSAKTYATDWIKTGDYSWICTDDWGNKRERLDPVTQGEVVKGAIEDVNDIKSYRFPDFSNQEDYISVKETCEKLPDKWIMGVLPGFTFNIARNLFKMENYLAELLTEPEAIHDLHDKIDSMIEKIIINYASAGVEGVFFCEDWGTQSSTLISPALWYSEFFPRFSKLCQTAHECNLKVFMHSCGKIGGIIPGMIESGIDVLQFDQPELHGIDRLKEYQEKYKITFWCPVDIQTTLQSRNETIIRSKAKEMLEKLWRGQGGFIAGCYGDSKALGLDDSIEGYAMDEFIKAGKREFFK